MADYLTSEGKRLTVPGGVLPRLGYALLGVPHLGYRARLQRYRSFLQDVPCGTMVELGCGYGFLGRDLPARCYAGVDTDADRLRRARAGGRAAVRGDLCRAPFAAHSADVVVMAEVLEHLPDPETALAEAARLLKPDGILLVSVPYPDAGDCDAFGHAHPGYTQAALRDLLTRAGWQVERLAPYGGELFARAWRAQRALPGGIVAATLWFLLMLPLLWLDPWLATTRQPIGWIVRATPVGRK